MDTVDNKNIITKFDLKKIRVGFYHKFFPYGGGEKITSRTVDYFKTLGIESTIFVKKRAVFSKISEVEKTYDIEYIPSENKVSFLEQRIKELDIKILFIVQRDRNFLKIANKTNCKIVYWMHGMPMWKNEHVVGIMQHRFFRFIEKPCFKFVRSLAIKIYHRKYLNRMNKVNSYIDAFIVLCPQYADKVLKGYGKKIYPIINTYSFEKDVAFAKKKKIAFVGRLSFSDKRVDRLIRIWGKIYKKLPDWELDIYGEGKSEISLLKQVKKNNIERVNFNGWVLDTQKIYDESSILCLTSSYEGFPNVMLEAQMNGVIPIGFDSFGALEFIVEGNAGISVPAFDEDKYAEELYNLCIDEDRRKQIQANCLDKSKIYNNEFNLTMWKRLFSDLAGVEIIPND